MKKLILIALLVTGCSSTKLTYQQQAKKAEKKGIVKVLVREIFISAFIGYMIAYHTKLE